MPKITALLHTHHDALRLGRALDSLRPCDEVLIIDDGSEDDTARIAREHGAKLSAAIPGVTPGAYALDASHLWILCLRPNEALSDDLEAALFEWKAGEVAEGTFCYSVSVRQETDRGWMQGPAEVRLVKRELVNWVDEMPDCQPCQTLLTGDLLSFRQP